MNKQSYLFVNGKLDGLMLDVRDDVMISAVGQGDDRIEYRRQHMIGTCAERFGKSVFVTGALTAVDLERAKLANDTANGVTSTRKPRRLNPVEIIRALLADLGPGAAQLDSVRDAYDYLENLDQHVLKAGGENWTNLYP